MEYQSLEPDHGVSTDGFEQAPDPRRVRPVWDNDTMSWEFPIASLHCREEELGEPQQAVEKKGNLPFELKFGEILSLLPRELRASL